MVTIGCGALGMRLIGGDLRDDNDGGEGAAGGTHAFPTRCFSATGEVDEIVDRWAKGWTLMVSLEINRAPWTLSPVPVDCWSTAAVIDIQLSSL
jgi:hypothetical protein